ncbi:MAG: hypothetical protein AAFP19_16120, partial [Bacteroidota bacterium]
FFFISLNALSAQQLQLGDILEKHFEARGGKEKVEAIHSLIFKQRVESEGFDFPQTVTIIPDSSIRVESINMGTETVVCWNGENGWQINPYSSGHNNAYPLKKGSISRLIWQTDIRGPLMDYEKEGHRLVYTGTEKTDGRNSHVLLLTYKNGYEERLYISTKDYRLLKIKSKEREIYFDNYRRIDDVLFPFTTEIYSNNGGTMLIEIESVSLNQVIDKSTFEQPNN